jgi:hypothetical protein
MAENKKSFIAYIDWGSTFDELDDFEAGQLVKLLFDYVRDKNPEAPSKLIKVAFDHIKQDLKRDLKKWDQYIDKQRANGQKGGRPKETQKTQAFFEEPKKADNVFVNVNVNDNDNVNDIYEIPLTKCVEIALRDEKYARLNKLVGPADFEPFIEKLETEGCYFKTPIDFKAHFARWKKKQPDKPKEIPIRPIREQDKWF